MVSRPHGSPWSCCQSKIYYHSKINWTFWSLSPTTQTFCETSHWSMYISSVHQSASLCNLYAQAQKYSNLTYKWFFVLFIHIIPQNIWICQVDILAADLQMVSITSSKEQRSGQGYNVINSKYQDILAWICEAGTGTLEYRHLYISSIR